MIWHGGAVMGTAETGPIVITPIFWNPPGNPMAASYKSLITQYLSDVAAASGSTTNVCSVLTQYTGSDGQVQYQVRLGNPINDTNALPADGCTLNHKDTANIYADASGYNACLTDAQVQGQVNSVVAQDSVLGHRRREGAGWEVLRSLGIEAMLTRVANEYDAASTRI